MTACSNCGEELPEEIDEGTGVYCENCGHGQMVTDGSGEPEGSYWLEQIRELRSSLEEIGEWLKDATDGDADSMESLYRSEHSREEASEEIELDGFTLYAPEYEELLGLIERGIATAEEPIAMGTRNRVLIRLIEANPERYGERLREAREQREAHQERVREAFNKAARDANLTRRHQRLNEEEAVDIEIDSPEDEEDDS